MYRHTQKRWVYKCEIASGEIWNFSGVLAVKDWLNLNCFLCNSVFSFPGCQYCSLWPRPKPREIKGRFSIFHWFLSFVFFQWSLSQLWCHPIETNLKKNKNSVQLFACLSWLDSPGSSLHHCLYSLATNHKSSALFYYCVRNPVFAVFVHRMHT